MYDAASDPLVAMTERESGLWVSELQIEGSLRAGQVWRDSARHDLFKRFTTSSDGSERVLRTITPREDGALVVEISAASESAASGRSTLVRGEGGEIVIVSNLANKIESVFEPEALFLPASLAAGEEFERSIGVRSEGPLFGSGSGDGVSRLRGIGTQTIATPAGRFRAFVIDSELTFGVGPARIELTQRAWIALDEPGLGIVAEEGTERVRVFGIAVHSERRVSVLSQAAMQD